MSDVDFNLLMREFGNIIIYRASKSHPKYVLLKLNLDELAQHICLCETLSVLAAKLIAQGQERLKFIKESNY